MKGTKVGSGKELSCSHKNHKPNTSGKEGSPHMEEGNEDGWVDVQKPIPQLQPARHVLKLPYPQRQQRNKMNKKFQEILNIFRKLTINIPFVEALEQMFRYAMFMKQIFSKKKRLEEFETVALNEECHAMFQSSQS